MALKQYVVPDINEIQYAMDIGGIKTAREGLPILKIPVDLVHVERGIDLKGEIISLINLKRKLEPEDRAKSG